MLNNCKIMNNTVIKNIRKGSADTTCSEPTVTMKTGNIFEKKKLPTNFQMNFRRSHNIWREKNKPFKSYLKKLARAGVGGGGGGVVITLQ